MPIEDCTGMRRRLSLIFDDRPEKTAAPIWCLAQSREPALPKLTPAPLQILVRVAHSQAPFESRQEEPPRAGAGTELDPLARRFQLPVACWHPA